MTHIRTFAAFVLAPCGGGRYAATTRPGKVAAIGLPGGKLEAGETPREAALREAFEEGWLVDSRALETEPCSVQTIENEKIVWFRAAWAIKLPSFKEEKRIAQVAATKEEVIASQWGNQNLFRGALK